MYTASAPTSNLPSVNLAEGVFRVQGGEMVIARHFTDDGRPLLAAGQVATMAGIKQRTVYQWERRGYLKARGLDECGNRLYDAGEAAMVASSPRRRNAA